MQQLREMTHEAVDLVARRSRSKLLAYLAGRSGDLEAAEDALSDAFVTALAVWPERGRPNNPEAWLLAVARNRMIDQHRGNRELPQSDELDRIASAAAEDSLEQLPDRRLALLFACTHPAIDAGVRSPLMLQVVLGLEASQIASAFLVSPSAMAQRLVRAKTKIRDARIPFTIPGPDELDGRLSAVLDAVYAAFSQGWADPAGIDVARRQLAGEAIYLGKLLVELAPGEPEAWGLLALMLYTEARRPARRGERGEFIPLAEQDRSRWDHAMIAEAETALRCASEAKSIGRYQLEAAIQSAHVKGALAGSVPWADILQIYDALATMTGSPVALLNRAVAVAEVRGAREGLAELNRLNEDGRLNEYQPYWAARAELLTRSGERDAASDAYQLAIGLESDPAVREYLAERRERCVSQHGALRS